MLEIIHGSRYANTNRTPLARCSWTAAFLHEFDYDAHAWAYLFYDDQGDLADPQLRVASKNGEPATNGLLLFNFLFFDYDGEEEHDEILELLARIPRDHYLFKVAVLYFTKGGVRLVYRLAEPLLAGDYGPVVRGMAIDLWQLTTLRIDVSTDQWWRCFRLPKVDRNDKKATGPTWKEDYFREPFLSAETEVDPEELPRRSEKLPWATYEPASLSIDAEMPDSDRDLHGIRQRLYKNLLRTSRFRHYIFDGVEVLPGRMDQTLLAMAGETVARAFAGIPEADPEEIFILLSAVARPMPPDAMGKLWRLVLHAWTQESKKKEDREKQLKQDCSLRDITIEKMLSHLPSDDVPNDPIQRRFYATRHYCLQTGTSAFVVQKDGSYSTIPLRTSQLPAHFNDGLVYLNDDGFRTPTGIPLGGESILNSFSINLDGVEYSAEAKQETRLLKIGERRVLQISPFSLRSDLVEHAELDKDVGGWLDCFADPVQLKRWLASSLALHKGGTAALYLHGPARVGKTMLAMGLADCFHAQPVPGAQAFSEFNGGLFDSPIIMIDEGLPSRTNGVDIADMFRSMVTGSPISIMRKHRDAVTSKIPYRLIFAANSFDMVKQLIGRRTMAPQDRDAFRERILVMDTGVEPAKFLDSRGAMDFTKHHTKGSWIGGDCRLARHLIRLYQLAFEESEFARDGRLLVEGRSHPSFTLSFDLSGAGRDVVDDLIADITKTHTGKTNSVEIKLALHIDERSGRVWLKKRPFTRMACMRNNIRNAEPYSIALDRFLKMATRTSPTDMAMEQEVDLQKLIFCGSAEGLNTSVLTALELQGAGIS